MSNVLTLEETDIRLLLGILNNVSIKGKDSAIQIVRIMLALESVIPVVEEE